MLKKEFFGDWTGKNRLWFDKPEPARSEGAISVSKDAIDYQWSFQGKEQQGTLRFFGPNPSLRVEWQDTFHSKDKVDMHGSFLNQFLELFGTYPDGEGGEWGWKIEIDFRDPEFLRLRMYNVEPNGNIHIAVDLTSSRED